MIIILNNTLIDGRVGSFQELEANKADKTDLAAYTKTPDLGNLHVWSLTDAEGNIEYLVNANANAYTEGDLDYKAAYYELGDVINGDFLLANSPGPSYQARYSMYTTIIVDKDGEISLDTSTEQSGYFNGTQWYGTDSINDFIGKFIVLTSYTEGYVNTDAEIDTIYYIPTDATVTTYYANNRRWYTVDKYQTVTGYPETKSGTRTYIGQLGDGGPKIATGSYTGTGTYGASNPCSLTFDFEPRYIYCIGYKSSSGTFYSLDGSFGVNYHCKVFVMDLFSTNYVQTTAGWYATTNYIPFVKKSADSKSIYWYNTQSASHQFNETNVTYYYFAMG